MPPPNPSSPPSTPLIAVEELFLSSEVLVGTSPTDPALHIIPAPALTKLRTLGIQRTRDMRATSTTLQIISHVTIDAPAKQCQVLNDKLHSSIVANQDRFKALALLPSWDAKEAAAELQRCVTKHRFVGGVIGVRRGGWGGSAWEGALFGGEKDKEWDEVWRVAEQYGVPLAVRVLWPTRDQLSEYEGQYPGQIPPSIVAGLLTNFHNLNSTSPLLVLRWYLAGVFDRHPNLRIILSQKGHDIPTLFPQIDSFLASLPSALKPKRTFQDVWQTNFYVTTADTLDLAGMKALIKRTPLNRILYAGGEPGRNLMSELQDSEVVSKEEYERIAWKNAEVLFGLKGNEKVAGPGDKKKIALEKLAFFDERRR